MMISLHKNATTTPGDAALIALPSSSDTLIVGSVTFGSLPPRPMAPPVWLLAMITPTAPAAQGAAAAALRATQ